MSEMRRRQASYMRREDGLKKQIQELQQEVTRLTAERGIGFLDSEKK
jgi:hypothetical protein